MKDLMKRATALFWIVVEMMKPVAPLLARVVLGHAFVQTGLGKWQNLPDVVEFFASLGLPAPAANAAFIATLEVVGGAALIAGIGTNLFAALLSATMVVALATADRAAFLGALTGGGEHALIDVLPVMFLLPLTWLIAFGAGPLSVDHLARRWWRAPAAAPTKVTA
jgi:putative oxidoreductase